MGRARAVVLGASHWHVPLCADQIAKRHEVVGLSDPAPVEDLERLWDAPRYSTWNELVAAHADADLAYVFVPHDEMRDACLALIAAGIPIVVDKPLGTSLDDVVQVRVAAEAADVPVAVLLVQRGGPVETWLSRAGRSVYESVHFIAGPPERYLANGSVWMVEEEHAGGGCMVNLAPHFVDLFLQSAGTDEVTATAALSSNLHGRGIEDFASLTLVTDDERIATIEVGYAFPGSPLKRHCSFMRIGDAGAATIWADGSASFTAVDGLTDTTTIQVDSDPLYAAFIDRVADLLDVGWQGLPTISDLQATMDVIWHAYAGSRRRRTGVHSPQHR